MSRSPEILGDKAILDKLTELRQKGLEADGQIIDCTINSSFKKSNEKFLSPKQGYVPEYFMDDLCHVNDGQKRRCCKKLF